MKEYRIKATSAEHRKAIIGALKGLGFKRFGDISNQEMDEISPFTRFPWVVLKNRATIVVDSDRGVSNANYYETIDTLIADIIRDRQTVEVNIRGVVIKASPVAVIFHDTCGAPILTFAPADFDRIAEAVKKVRGK